MRNHMRRFIALALSLILCLSMGIQAFAVEYNHGTQTAAAETEDMYVAAQQAYDYLTDEQKETFITQIALLALAGDNSLVEFHQTYVDSSYEFNPEDYAAVPNVANAASVAGQLQALNLPTAVYYGLLAFATSLGVPVGNVVDVVVGLGLGAIILVCWDDIADVWDDIVDIFVDAFGSVVTDAFEYIEGLINGTANIDSDDVDWNGGDKNHIMRGTGDSHVEGFKRFGFDPRDPNNWNKLLPFLKEVVDDADRTEGPTSVNGGTIIKYFKYYVEQGVDLMVKIFFPDNGGTPRISDAIPYIQ